jgi:hypothetical protein
VVVFVHATSFHPKPKEQVMIIMGIDLGKFNSMVCIYNKTTQEHSFQNAATQRGYFRTLLTQPQKPDLVVVEACGPSG